MMSQRAAERTQNLTARVRAEMKRRGIPSNRAVAVGSGASNVTWDRFFETGKVTPKLRHAVATAFSWPHDWDEHPPPLQAAEAPDDGTVAGLSRRVAALEDRLAELEALRDRLAPQIGANALVLAELQHQVADLLAAVPPRIGQTLLDIGPLPDLAP